jgi:UDP-N-acetylglucosamine--N-acetylmuramyl-(pentapeptide) pyrophosphoryl-undecaprenol N-acetylglucosamine transferase
MKILFTGGGTGGHFYPIIAVAEQVNDVLDREKILQAKLYYMSDKPYDKTALFENGITFEAISAGKLRIAPKGLSIIKNFFDFFKTSFGILNGIFKVYFLFPDVVFSKGGYSAVPVLFAARLFRIPVVIHESDSRPGRTNLWAAKFAEKIAISWPEAVEFFPKDKVAYTGQPIRKTLLQPVKEGAYEYLHLDPSIPVIFVVGGSLGAEFINNVILDALPNLLEKYQVVHQTGERNFEEVTSRAKVILRNNMNTPRYKPIAFLNPLATKMAAGAATLIISRAGSMIFEIASWGVPAIIVPITESNGDHQRMNAYNYARTGACIVMEEANLSPSILELEIEKLINDPRKMEVMKKAALSFAKPDAALKIAEEIVRIALRHED